MQAPNALLDGIDQIRQRGANFTVKNNRLRIYPKYVYKALTEAQHLFIRRNRAAIKAAVLRGLPLITRTVAPAAPVAPEPIEPEPVMWTYDYQTRITAEHVQAAGVPPGLSKQKAYERARDWLEEQRQAREREAYVLSLHNAANERRGSAFGPDSEGHRHGGVWGDLAYD